MKSTSSGAKFDVIIADRAHDNERLLESISLPMYGQHNVSNALAAISIALEMGMTDEQIRTSLAGFSGVKRRFTKVGEAGGISIIDDYGHHPVEISAVLSAARSACPNGRVYAVVQPHRYSRLHDLFDDFCACFNDADGVVVADVYAAGEQPIEGADRDSLVAGLRASGHRHVYPLHAPEDLAGRIAELAEPGDLVVCLGAGNITMWAQALPDELARIIGRTHPVAGKDGQ